MRGDTDTDPGQFTPAPYMALARFPPDVAPGPYWSLL